MPIPSSATEITTLSFVVWVYTVIDLLTGVYLNALDNKLKIIFSTLSWSTQQCIDSLSVCRRRLMFFSSAMRRKLSITFCNSSTISVFSNNSFIFLFSILRKSSIWLTSRNMRSVLLWTTVRSLRALGVRGSCWRTSPTGLVIRVKGVRNSWEISVKNRNFIFASCCSI